MQLTPETMTTQELSERLYHRAEEIFLLCAVVNRRGLAHAFCDLSGHTQSFDCETFPVDADYNPEHATPSVNRLQVQLGFSEMLLYRAPEDYRKRMEQLDDYAMWLDRLIEGGEPVMIRKELA